MIEKIALLFMMIFAIIGTMFVSIVVHEYSHYNDFKDFNVTDERLCMLVIPTEKNFNNMSSLFKTPIAYYYYKIDDENMTPEELARYMQKAQRSEVNAYTFGSLIFLFYIVCYMIISFGRFKDKRNISLYKSKIQDNENYINELEDYIRDMS